MLKRTTGTVKKTKKHLPRILKTSQPRVWNLILTLNLINIHTKTVLTVNKTKN